MPFKTDGYSIMLSKDRFTAIVLALIVWGFAGALFGALFAALHRILLIMGLPGWWTLVMASAAASMTTMAFYSAMPVALVGSMAGVLVSIGYLIVIGHPVEWLMILGLSAGTGILGGTFYSWVTVGGSRSLAETLTGLLIGLVAAILLSLVLWFVDEPVGVFALTAGLVALTGTLFELSERRLVRFGITWLPGIVSAPLVAGLVAAVVAGGIWMLGSTTAIIPDAHTQQAIAKVWDDIPPGLLGGSLGGALTSLVLEIFGFRLEDEI
ncbi:MAG: spermidine synthase [Thermochromatium sp.]